MKAACLSLVLIPALPALGGTIHVDVHGGAQFTAIQDALDAAIDDDTVLVAPGEYLLVRPLDMNRLFEVFNPQGPPRKNVILKSEGGPDANILRMSDHPEVPNAASVLVFKWTETDQSMVEGFTITGGQGSWDQQWGQVGGGILSTTGSTPILRNCIIAGNSNQPDLVKGGGICCLYSSPVLVDCMIKENEAYSGGGIACINSSPAMTRCTITRNSAEQAPAVFTLQQSHPVIEHCLITENFGFDGEGGGLFCDDRCSPHLINCIISRNTIIISGGGIFCRSDSNPTIENCSISGNSPHGVYCDASYPTLINCEISGNREGVACSLSSPTLVNCIIDANGSAGVRCDPGSLPRIHNCTIADNSGAGIKNTEQSAPSLINCIVWGNGGGSVSVPGTDSDPRIKYSCVEGEPVFPGAGNFNQDPLFVSRGVFDFERVIDLGHGPFASQTPGFVLKPGDYHLMPGSPCIDRGDSAGAPNSDLEGQSRPCGPKVDAGAYEFCSPTTILFKRGEANGDGLPDLADVIFSLDYLFLGGEEPHCLQTADVDGSDELDISDPIALLGHLFLSDPTPAAPFPDCGLDPSHGKLSCISYPACG